MQKLVVKSARKGRVHDIGHDRERNVMIIIIIYEQFSAVRKCLCGTILNLKVVSVISL